MVLELSIDDSARGHRVDTWSGDRLKTAVLGCVACALLLLISFASHAIDRGTVAIIIYFIHEVAAALWIGAVLGLWFGAVRANSGRVG